MKVIDHNHLAHTACDNFEPGSSYQQIISLWGGDESIQKCLPAFSQICKLSVAFEG
jgi:hypothetical protein